MANTKDKNTSICIRTAEQNAVEELPGLHLFPINYKICSFTGKSFSKKVGFLIKFIRSMLHDTLMISGNLHAL